MNTKKIIVYGSLMENEYNFNSIKNYFGYKSIKKIKDITLNNYLMFSFGFYPAIIESKGIENSIKAEIIEVNEDAFNHINNMELGAGYKSKNINIENEDYIIYVFSSKEISIELYPKVKDGNWKNYKKIKV
jgi:gamma-glutamylcyclotransferase (GGCT)/AIG2-like uncharacterized protein YtfP